MSGTVELKKYEYRPLREGPNNIRLVQILPGTGDAAIICQVFQYTLRNEKAFGLYEALSYVWGDFNNLHDILIRNSEDSEYRNFRVTHNLYGALRRLRDPDLPRTFWIDAICINQDDLQERAMQVMIMARIYAYATSVSVWLGEDGNDSLGLFDLLQDVFSEDFKASAEWLQKRSSRVLPAADTIQALLDRPWFRRAWVVQEAAVARVISVTCGNAEIPGAMFARGLQVALWDLEDMTKREWILPAVVSLMDRTTSNLPLLQRISTLQMSKAIPSFEIAPLGELLKLFEDHEATDERDRIYALLGLSSDNALTTDLRPDYTKSWSDLFRQVIKHVLGSTAVISVVEGKGQAVISDFGCTLALVTENFEGQVTAQCPLFGQNPTYSWHATWPVHGGIRRNDILIYLQGARQPSIIRGCRDHFDIVAISVPPPVDVTIAWDDSLRHKAGVKCRWSEIVEGARSASRKFTLVWDWTSKSRHDETDHVSWIESEPGTHPNCIERCSNTSRVLDDLRLYGEVARLLRARPRTATLTAEEEHLILLEHACALRREYSDMRLYLEDVRWSLWMLSAPINSDYLRDYWRRYGYLGLDLYDIIQFVKAHQESAVEYDGVLNPYNWIFERFDQRLYSILFPQFRPSKYKSGSHMLTERALSPHNGRYLMRLLLANEAHLHQPSQGVLERMRRDPAVGYKYSIVIAILKEHPSTQLETDEIFQRALQTYDNKFVHYWDLRFLLREFSNSSVLTHDLLQDIAYITQSWHYSQFKPLIMAILGPLVDIFVRHVKDLTLCHLEILMWTTAQKPFHSVLSFLYENYADYKPGALSRPNLHVPFPTTGLTRWAQRAILQAIAHRKKRQASLQSRNQEGITGPILYSSSNSSDEFSSTASGA